MITVSSPNFNERRDVSGPDMLVLHYTGMESCDAALERLCDPAAEVSAHYLIDDDGTQYRLVDEDKRAWHAGKSGWRGHNDINSRSIGIELVNPGHEFGYREFPDPQIAQLITLCVGILGQHQIPKRNIVGHSDIAPSRKIDPGELFPWPRLAEAGIGLWPGDCLLGSVTPDVGKVMLCEIGYLVDDVEASISAFQRRFRPDKIDGTPDRQTGELIAAVHQLFTDPA